MTEHWRRKLGDLDKQSPSDDVFERAKEGPMHAEDPLPHVKTEQTARRFAQEMMGWSDPFVIQEAASVCANTVYWETLPSASPLVIAEAVGSSAPATDGPEQCTSVGSTGNVSSPGDLSIYPTATPSSGSDCAFVSYRLLLCGGPPCAENGSEKVTLYQPLQQGPGQIWAVMEARSDSITLSTAASQTVRSGASIGATFAYQHGVHTLGYSSCGSSGGSSDGREAIPGIAISIDTALVSTESCNGPQAGYVWADRRPHARRRPWRCRGGPGPGGEHRALRSDGGPGRDDVPAVRRGDDCRNDAESERGTLGDASDHTVDELHRSVGMDG